MSDNTNSNAPVLDNSSNDKTLAETVIEFQSGTDNDPVFKRARAAFILDAESRIKSFSGNVHKLYESISIPLAYACAQYMAFHSSNSIGLLWYEVSNKGRDGFGNDSLADAIKEVAFDFFGVVVGSGRKEGELWSTKNRKEDLKTGLCDAKDMDKEEQFKVLKVLEAGGFKQLVVDSRELHKKNGGGRGVSEEKPLILTKDQKTDPNCIKAMEVAKKFFKLKGMATQGISDPRIIRVSRALERLSLELSDLEDDILAELKGFQASTITQPKVDSEEEKGEEQEAA